MNIATSIETINGTLAIATNAPGDRADYPELRSYRMMGRGGTRLATILNPARSNVVTVPVDVALGERLRSNG